MWSIKEAELFSRFTGSAFQNLIKIYCEIKRGCSEYYSKYPNYNRLDDKALKYNSIETSEIKFDEKIQFILKNKQVQL